MADPQDRAEMLDDDKGAFPADDETVIDLVDQTADSDGTSAIDEGESGDGLDGVGADTDNGDDPFHTEEPAPEVAAMHIVNEP